MDHTITGLLPVSCKNAPETEHQNAIIPLQTFCFLSCHNISHASSNIWGKCIDKILNNPRNRRIREHRSQ